MFLLSYSNYEIRPVQISQVKSQIKLFFLLLCTTLLDAFGIPCSLYLALFEGEASQTSFALKSLQIISTGLLCFLILHFGIYRHQYLAIGLVVIESFLSHGAIWKPK